MNASPNAASVALIRAGQVLLIQRAFEPWRGAWTLPGGRTEAGESAEHCAVREIREELGLAISDLQPVTTLTLGPEGRYRLTVFVTDCFEGEIALSDEIGALCWRSPRSIGDLPTTPDLPAVLARAFALLGSEVGGR